MIEFTYLITGLLLPLFYVPQILRIREDRSLLAAYSLNKATAQLILRLPALIFAVVVVQSDYMIIVLCADVLGRVVEWATAVWVLRKQDMSKKLILKRINPLRFLGI